ncbi:MAG: hypothetical protein HZA03_05795 [Nitrospinae bacterium]|nr:hypothetical protein [Nitrospinota bacterium]
MLNNGFKTALVAVVGAAFLIAGGCGTKADSNTYKVGPTGPTSPGGYYFTLDVHPAVVIKDGTTHANVWVTNAAGTPIDGTVTTVYVFFSGTGAAIDPIAIDANGRAGMFLTVTGAGGTNVQITANVGDKSLTIPVQILP